MTLLQFIATVIQAIAWPVAVLVIVVLLRKPIKSILPNLTKLRYKDFELDFRRELNEISDIAKSSNVSFDQYTPARDSPGGPKSASDLLDEATALASDFPEPAVAVAWSAVEGDLLGAVERNTETDAYRRKSASHLIKLLDDRNVIDAGTVEVLRRMQKLRNIAVHERWNAFGGISSDEAFEFIALADGVHRKLGNARGSNS
jgi:hypothetical protein